MPLAAARLLLLSVLGGCGAQAGGGQTGEESGDGCVLSTSLLSRDERSPLGFSAGQVLAFAEGEHSAGFNWLQAPGFSYGPESGAGNVTVQTSAVGPAKLARIDTARSQAHCEDHLRIPVSVGLASAGGALDEEFTVDLIAATADAASVKQIVPSTALTGAFAFEPGTLGERRFSRLEVNLHFGPAAFAGYLFAGIESRDDASGSASFQPLPLACWSEIPSLSPACPAD
jgi:hypothetical protein